jgi:hypothetical protein
MKLARLLLPLLLAAPAMASPRGDFDERWQLNLGGSIKRFDTGIRVDSETLGRSQRFRLEDVLGLDREQINGRVWGTLRLGHRHRLALDYTFWVRRSDRTLDEEFRIGDDVYEIDAFLRSELTIQSLQVLYRFSVFHGSRGEAGFTVGVSGFLLDGEVRAAASAGGSGGETVSGVDVIAPVPVLGVFGAFTPGASIILRGRAEFLSVRIDEWDVGFLQATVSGEWYFLDPVGLGARFHLLESLVIEDTEPRKEYEIDQSGPEFFVAARF